MNAPKVVYHVLAILLLLSISVVFALLSKNAFILSLINSLFLIGLLLFIIGSVMLIFLWGTFDVVSRGFRLLKKAKYPVEQQALMEVEIEEKSMDQHEKERKAKRKGNIALALLFYGILFVVLSFALLPIL